MNALMDPIYLNVQQVSASMTKIILHAAIKNIASETFFNVMDIPNAKMNQESEFQQFTIKHIK